MKRFAVAASLSLVLFGCATPHGGASQPSSVPGHGAISLTITPNPVVAQKVSESTYDFPFDVNLRETGGHPVTINRVTADVYAVGGIRVASETYDAAKIGSLGYSTAVPANGRLTYHFAPRKQVMSDVVFNSLYTDIRIDVTDETGDATAATTRVTVTR